MGKLLLVVLVACGPPMPSNDLVDAPPDADLVVQCAVDAWSERLERDLPAPPLVLWFDGECLDYGDRCLGGATMTGYAGEPEIHLPWRPSAAQAQVRHEVLHWALYVSDLPDVDHSGPYWESLTDVPFDRCE